MTNSALNKYILHYIEQDRTKSAIMLTGGWGTGKSYYIQNELIPFLSDEKNGNHQCIVISLYGLADLSDVSKNLYWETKAKWLRSTSEGAAVGMATAKTVIKGIASAFSISIDPSEEDLNRIYRSADFSGKLIIIEDVERVQFGITKFLGYVNSLVEQDGVKVLLVANEGEIIQYEPLAETDPEKKETAELLDRVTEHKGRAYTPETETYLASKEKTVSDTLVFEGDIHSAIREIIGEYHDEMLTRLSSDADIDEIEQIMNERGDYNLRSFLFACQKTHDIFQQLPLDQEYDEDFLKTIFMGIVSFTIRIKSGEKCRWSKGSDLSFDLGNTQYPLFRFCYDSILFQRFDSSLIIPAEEDLRELRLYDEHKSSSDQDLIVLYNWHLQSEKDARTAVSRVTSRLENPSDFSFYEYGRIAYYLIKLSHVLSCDISQAKHNLIKNLYNKGDRVRADYLFLPFMRDEDQSVVDEYQELEAEMTESLNAAEETIFGFTYMPADISTFYAKATSKDGDILSAGSFAARLNADRIVEMLKYCSAIQIHDFRGAFLSVYRPVNIGQFLSADRPAIENLLLQVKQLENYEGYDTIQKIQIHYFTLNLEEILDRL